MQKILKSISLLSVLFLAACSTTNVGNNQTTGPVEYKGEDASTLYVLREKAPPIAVKANLLIDGKNYGKLGSRTYMKVLLPPGQHEVKISFPILAATPSSKGTITLDPGQEAYLYHSSRLGAMPAGMFISPSLVEIDESTFEELFRRFKKAE